ncbi:MAG: cysteine synthase A [Lentisphaerae bacterium]|jgi:cysteine synthase A|nr:cysteine synthase A [Lentisphaerota bacterium]
MSNIYNDVSQLIGNTPLVRVNRLNMGKAEILVKMESFNPASSVKDRIALSMLEAAEKEGKVKSGSLVIEATSGNTGIGLALVSAVKGYRLMLTMPETMSIERRKLLQAYGAELVLTPGSEGMKGAVDRAEELCRENPGSFIPSQFDNPANVEIHKRTTAEEIYRDTGGKVDVLISGVGTGGTVSGVGEVLKQKIPGIKIIALEPDSSPLLSGGQAGPHKIQGLGANFVPSIFNAKVVDKVMTVSAEDAGATARAAAKKEGMLIGISSGAALHIALKLSRMPEYEGKRIVAILPDSGERYLSTWLFE